MAIRPVPTAEPCSPAAWSKDWAEFHIFYTGDNGANPKGTEFIMHATSPDLVTWTEAPGGHDRPRRRSYKNARMRDFRDPVRLLERKGAAILDGLLRQ